MCRLKMLIDTHSQVATALGQSMPAHKSSQPSYGLYRSIRTMFCRNKTLGDTLSVVWIDSIDCPLSTISKTLHKLYSTVVPLSGVSGVGLDMHRARRISLLLIFHI